MERNKYRWAVAFLVALFGVLLSIVPLVLVLCDSPVARYEVAFIIGMIGWFYALAITIKQLGGYL